MAGSWPLAGCGLNHKCTRGERNVRHASVRFGCFLSVTPFPCLVGCVALVILALRVVFTCNILVVYLHTSGVGVSGC